MIRPNGWGACISLQGVQYNGLTLDSIVEALKPDWWMNWSYRTYGASADGFIPMLWSNTWNSDVVRQGLLDMPGRTWLIHNEPHRPDQANLTPEEAADDVKRFMTVAWEAGVEFQAALGGCGVVDETTDGIEWMRDFMYLLRRTGLSRSSYMHFHGYRFNSVEQARRGLDSFMTLWDEVGLGAPIVISEFCAENTSPANQMKVMDEVRQWIADGKISGAAWFCANDGGAGWPLSTLCNVPTGKDTGLPITLTEIGKHWVDLKR